MQCIACRKFTFTEPQKNRRNNRFWISNKSFWFCFLLNFISLTPVQREWTIERLNAGQRPQLVADVFNCNVRTIQRLRICYNATNSTLDRLHSGRQRVTTQRQERYMRILRHHLQDRFAISAQTDRQTIGIN